MNYKDKLLELFTEAKEGKTYKKHLDDMVLQNIQIIAEKSEIQKGVFTVFITLCIYKLLNPSQDIRIHQSQQEGGFSGRTVDTKFITPTLKELGLPSMAESGWLTRSLEQPFPYTLEYQGRISNKSVKKSFLELIDLIENKNINPKYVMIELFIRIIKIQEDNVIEIIPLKYPDKLTIKRIIKILEVQFSFNYKTFGGSKLPVLAFYSIYQLLIKELKRFDKCKLIPLNSHTSSDKTSKSSGDIEVFKADKLFESIEIKLDKPIDLHLLRIVKKKIFKFNPKRYYLLSLIGLEKNEENEITNFIQDIKNKHGCQIVVNGILDTLKYYLRLIDNLDDFILNYSNLIENDTELKKIHKARWNHLLMELNNEL